MLRPIASVGIDAVDELLEGGFPLGAIAEIVGPECSGRTSLALSFLSRMTMGKVCAWIDVSNALHPDSAAAAGVDLSRLLWVRCGVSAPTDAWHAASHDFALPEKYLVAPPIKKGLHGGGFGPHPRHEAKGLSDVISGFLRPAVTAPRCAEPQRRMKKEKAAFEPRHYHRQSAQKTRWSSGKPWSRIEQALRVLTCCCRRVASVQSCWIWEALRLNTPRAYRWRHGSVIALLRSEAKRASSC